MLNMERCGNSLGLSHLAFVDVSSTVFDRIKLLLRK